MRISEVAARSGVASSTLRFYEERGLLSPARTANGYRDYDASTLDALRFIEAAKRLDLRLDEIGGVLEVWRADSCRTVRSHLRPLVSAQLVEIESALSALTDLREHLVAADAHLAALPDRDTDCDPSCGFLTLGERPSAPAPSPPPPPPPPPPVACSLDGVARADQLAAWAGLAAAADRSPVRQRGDRVAVTLTLPVASLSVAADTAAKEQACCPFFSVEIRLHGAKFELVLAAPASARLLLEELVGA